MKVIGQLPRVILYISLSLPLSLSLFISLSLSVHLSFYPSLSFSLFYIYLSLPLFAKSLSVLFLSHSILYISFSIFPLSLSLSLSLSSCLLISSLKMLHLPFSSLTLTRITRETRPTSISTSSEPSHYPRSRQRAFKVNLEAEDCVLACILTSSRKRRSLQRQRSFGKITLQRGTG